MTHIEIWIQSPLALALAKTLLHSFWQAGIVAFALGIGLRFIHPAHLRYVAGCSALAAAIALSIGTFVFLAPASAGRPSLQPIVYPDSPVPALYGVAASGSTRFVFQDVLPWITPVWLLGFLIFNFRQIGNWVGARRMRRRGVCVAPDAWQQRLNELRSRMKVLKPVFLLESCLTRVPLVVGHMRPAILLPLGLLTGLSSERVELLLMHELAHIRRADYLINMLQTFAESAMFYNPAVWWISRLIRVEREHCCDDAVVDATNNALVYAAALTALEENRSRHAQLVMAATGGTLMKRIRRLLRQPEPKATATAPILAAFMIIVAITGLLMARPATTHGPEHLEAAGTTAPPSLTPPLPVPQPPPQPVPQPVPVQSPRAKQTPAPFPAPTGPQGTLQRWLNEDVVYLITAEERAAYLGLSTDAERERFIEQFWLRRDPTPGTPENEARDEHYSRLAYVNEHLGTSLTTPPTPGWRTDRGRILIRYGRPDEIESHPSGGTYDRPLEQGGPTTRTFPFEIWLYKHIDGVGDKVLMEFVDPNGTGEFRQTTAPPAPRQQGQVIGSLLALEPTASEIFVLGEATQRGGYILHGENLTLLHALELAQGADRPTALPFVRVKRNQNSSTSHFEIRAHFGTIESGVDDIPLQPDDIVFVPRI
jgi:GWxTD domain-containing protein